MSDPAPVLSSQSPVLPREAQIRFATKPDRERWFAWVRFVATFFIVFIPVYFGLGHLGAWLGRGDVYALDIERSIPIIPLMILPYASLLWIYLVPLLHLTPAEIRRLSWQMTATLLVAGAVFVLFPGRVGFHDTTVTGDLAPLYAFIRGIDAPNNAWPSLHVACGTLLLVGCAERATAPFAWGYSIWLALMTISTVLTHQHHLIDVATGFGLAVAVRRAIPLGPKLIPSRA